MLARTCLVSLVAFGTGCATDTTDDTAGTATGGGKADDSVARQHGVCSISAMLKHERPNAIPELATGDLMRFTLDIANVEVAIEPRFGGGTNMRELGWGEVHISQPVRQLDPDKHIVTHPFKMDLSISEPRRVNSMKWTQDFSFRAEVFDVFAGEIKVFETTTLDTSNVLPYTENFLIRPDSASAIPGDHIGDFVFCMFEDGVFVEPPFVAIDDVAVPR
jgi:hypothetical protein